MSSDEERRRVLDLLAQSKVTVEEADQLLRALAASHAEPERSATPDAPRPRMRFMRIAVHKAANQWRPEKEVAIRVPLSLMRSGMRLGALIPGAAGQRVSDLLREKLGFDLSKLDQVQLEDALQDLGELTVDVDQGKEQVRITCE